MPIKPYNRARYPSDWPAIRARILARAHDCCEQCGVLNRARIARGDGDDAGTYMTDDANVYDAATGQYLGRRRMSEYTVRNMVDVVLTIGHLDHTPENCADDNLRALCQRCHLTYDAKHHASNASATRRARKAIGDLFAAAPEVDA
jgi:5-methylcytosine-specific restriction endonuclease McrA